MLSHTPNRWVLYAFATLLILIPPQNILADGKYFPERAFKKSPAIPTQRAILVFKDGVEKLTIESALDGQGQKFGWIIPVPSKPTNLEKASPGLIKTLSLSIQPKITHYLSHELAFILIIAYAITIWALFVLVFKSKSPFGLLLKLLVAGLLLLYLVKPTLHTTRTRHISRYQKTTGVTLQDVKLVGSYELAVLEADSSDRLNQWLSSNGFMDLTEEDKVVISEYIKEKWFFVAAKLQRTGSGFSRPHPISITFPAKIPVYPMRLTATLDSELYLELFVIAEKAAAFDKLSTELVDQFVIHPQGGKDFYNYKPLPGFLGKTYRHRVGHPDTEIHLWDKCFLTKLCGIMKPGQMKEDIILQFLQGRTTQKHYYSIQGAKDAGFIISLGFWCISIIVSIIAFHRKMNIHDNRKLYLKRTLLPLAVLSVLFGLLTYAILPKVDAFVFERNGISFNFEMNQFHQQSVERCILTKENSYFLGTDANEVTLIVKDFFKANKIKNPYTNKDIELEDSPGNYTIFKDERGIVLRDYSMNGFPSDFVLTDKPDK